MKRFLEYETASGRIVCEVRAATAPAVENGHAVIEIDEALLIDMNNSAVRDGVIVRLYETAEERRERERLRREHRERARRRVRGLLFEFMVAQIEEDAAKMGALREEYAHLKNYL